MGKIKSIILKDSERLALETGFRQGHRRFVVSQLKVERVLM